MDVPQIIKQLHKDARYARRKKLEARAKNEVEQVSLYLGQEMAYGYAISYLETLPVPKKEK